MIDLIKLHLNATGTTLCRYLQRFLPGIGGDGWWQTHVISQLTYGQQGQVRNRNITALGGLDLAALLRVFDRNWAELSHAAALPNELRTLLRELSDLRNSVAHHAADGTDMPLADAHRHFDTLGRVLKMLEADTAALDSIEHATKSALTALHDASAPKQSMSQAPAAVTPVFSPNLEDSLPVLETGIQIGSFYLLGPGEPFSAKIASFGGETVPASAIPWKVLGPNGLELLLHLVLIDEGTNAEFGQVFCESRLGSPQHCDDVVRRLRMGIRRLNDSELIMDLRCAVRPDGARATRNVKTLAEFDNLAGLNVASTLMAIGATTVGTRVEIANETNKNRNVLAVSFAADDLVTPAAAWVIATLQCLI